MLVIQAQYGNLFRRRRMVKVPICKISSIYIQKETAMFTHPFSFHRLVAHNDVLHNRQYVLTVDEKLNVIIAPPDPYNVWPAPQLWSFNI